MSMASKSGPIFYFHLPSLLETANRTHFGDETLFERFSTAFMGVIDKQAGEQRLAGFCLLGMPSIELELDRISGTRLFRGFVIHNWVE